MWVFGYGSLMNDGWEKAFEPLQRAPADLHGYARSFTKASVKNWGTVSTPGPTLRIVPVPDAVCRGMAFEFDDAQAPRALTYLQEREGRNFVPKSLLISFPDGSHAEAATFIYEGQNVIASTEEEIAAAIRNAVGTDGSARAYLERVKAQLDQMGIKDPAVTRLWFLVDRPVG